MLKHEKKLIAKPDAQSKTADTKNLTQQSKFSRQPHQRHRPLHHNHHNQNKRLNNDESKTAAQTLPKNLLARGQIKLNENNLKRRFSNHHLHKQATVVAEQWADVSSNNHSIDYFANISFPDELPVCACREAIIKALNHYQVVIICGETGSGKSTQVPKICLAMGRGRSQGAGQRKTLIGHTQPRRIAASTIAKRLADELCNLPEQVVGYKIRFTDTLSPSASIKLMTDGILLAETQSDPLLLAYDTIIIDEAHERSLNIDFLLGYLKLLLPKRPDLKVIVMSATIDAHRFAKYFYPEKENQYSENILSITNENKEVLCFDDEKLQNKNVINGNVDNDIEPIIQASGRLYDVEIRYRSLTTENLSLVNLIKNKSDFVTKPATESDAFSNSSSQLNSQSTNQSTNQSNKQSANYTATTSSKEIVSRLDLLDILINAVDELIKEGPGDVLVFFASEKEIREAADTLKQPFAEKIEILTLFARLSIREQMRVFNPSNKRRIILATNVAETSLTVPGIQFVIDTGNARVKRYSYRNKVEQLRIESISKAAAKQRSGRCGRVANGICIRLYEENDFEQRPFYTDPEILRSSLAAVILRMKALNLPDISCFPFLDMPSSRAIADGYQLLSELGAVDTTKANTKALTNTGIKLAKIPLDPRIGRMILAANEENALSEVLIIAAALSIQDPRERPFEQTAAADAAHRLFTDENSEFVSWIHIWKWMHEKSEMKPSRREWQSICRHQFLSVTRLREWREIHTQLKNIVRQQRWYINLECATYEQIHRSLLAGLLGNIGLKSADEKHYLGARGIKFFPWPASIFSKKSPAWLVSAELIETKRLYGRTLAKVDPIWIEKVGAHLICRSRCEPHWEKKNGYVTAYERATLHGLVLYQRRKVIYGKLLEEQITAREIFIKQALVMGDFLNKPSFLVHNEELIASIEKMEHQFRKQNILIDETTIFSFYDQNIPSDINNIKSFHKWYRQASYENKNLLMLSREILLGDGSQLIDETAYPVYLLEAGQILPLSYYFEPTSPRDGITVDIPLLVLNQVNSKRFEWLVPGMLQAKVYAFLKSLPSRYRRNCVPLQNYAEQFMKRRAQDDLNPNGKNMRHFLSALIDDLRKHADLELNENDFQIETIDKHHFMNFRIVDEHHHILAMDRHFSNLQIQLAEAARQTFQSVMKTALQKSFGAVEKENNQSNRLHSLTKYPYHPDEKPIENQLKNRIQIKQGQRITSQQETSSINSVVSNTNQKVDHNENYFTAAVLESDNKAQEQLPFEKKSFNRHHLNSLPVKNINSWSFGALPKEIALVDNNNELYGFPALVDNEKDCVIKIFDSKKDAQRAHWQGLRRLFILGLSQTTKNFEKKISNWRSLTFSYLSFKEASSKLLSEQIVARAIERCCMFEPLPYSKDEFLDRIEQGKLKFLSAAQNLAVEIHPILTTYDQVLQQINFIKHNEINYQDMLEQLNALVNAHFIYKTSDTYLNHINRYLKGILIRIDKLKADGQRDKRLMLEIMPIKQLIEQREACSNNFNDNQLQPFRWFLEELRISLFAQELKTPTPVSIKRFYKLWQDMQM